MRLLMLILVTGLLWAGCTTKKSATTSESSAGGSQAAAAKKPKRAAAGTTTPTSKVTAASKTITNGTMVVTLTETKTGKVVSVNSQLRFVVVDFSLNPLPTVDQRLGVFRGGAKVGELRISGPQYNNNIVADLIAGEAETGDQVR